MRVGKNWYGYAKMAKQLAVPGTVVHCHPDSIELALEIIDRGRGSGLVGMIEVHTGRKYPVGAVYISSVKLL